MTAKNHEFYQTLLVKAVDQLLTDDEQLLFQDHLSQCDLCSEEYSDFVAIKETTDGMTGRILADAAIEPPIVSTNSRVILLLGMTLVLAGFGILIGFGGYTFFSDPGVPTFFKVGFGVLIVGIVILSGYVLRIKLRGIFKDPYREIEQ